MSNFHKHKCVYLIVLGASLLLNIIQLCVWSAQFHSTPVPLPLRATYYDFYSQPIEEQVSCVPEDATAFVFYRNTQNLSEGEYHHFGKIYSNTLHTGRWKEIDGVYVLYTQEQEVCGYLFPIFQDDAPPQLWIGWTDGTHSLFHFIGEVMEQTEYTDFPS